MLRRFTDRMDWLFDSLNGFQQASPRHDVTVRDPSVILLGQFLDPKIVKSRHSVPEWRRFMARRSWRGLFVRIAIGSIAFASGCGGSSSDTHAPPPDPKGHEAMQKSMKEYMQKQMQKNMTKGRKSE